MAPLLAHKIKVMENLANLSRFYLPEIPCSIPLKCHPDFVALSRQGDQEALNIYRPSTPQDKKAMVQARISLFAPITMPYEGRSWEKTLAATRFMWHSAFFDDNLDDNTLEFAKGEDDVWLDTLLHLTTGNLSFHQISPEINALQSWKGSSIPTFFQFYHTLMRDLERLMSPVLFHRFVARMQDWVTGFKHTLKSHGLAEFTKESYFAFRRSNVLMYPVFLFLEMCMEICLDNEVLESSDYLLCMNAMCDHIWLVNELLSVGKDMRHKCYLNLLYVLLYTEPDINTFQEAINKVCETIQEKEQEFLYYNNIAVKNARASNKHEFASYLEQIPFFLSGNLRWHYITMELIILC